MFLIVEILYNKSLNLFQYHQKLFLKKKKKKLTKKQENVPFMQSITAITACMVC